MTTPLGTQYPLTEHPHSALFDMNRLGTRRATYRFDLVGIDGIYDSEPLHPIKESPPVLSHDTTRSIKRTLSMTLGVVDTARFDPVYHRVEPWMILGDVEYPLGRYMCADRTIAESTGGDQAPLVMTDELAQVGQQLESGFSALRAGNSSTIRGNGQNIREITLKFLAGYSLFNPFVGRGAPATGTASARLQQAGFLRVEADIEATPYATVNGWTAGTTGTQVLEDLAVSGDYWSPWIDNHKNFRMIRTFDPLDRVPLTDWDLNNQAIRGTPVRSDDLLTAPNRFIVIGNLGYGESADHPVVGRYDVPAAAPWSFARRGFVTSQVTDIQIQDSAQAQATAQAIGRRQTVYERVQVSTPPDPRHDSYDVLIWRGERWLELAWTMTLLEGQAMQHTLRKVYDDAGSTFAR